MRPNPETPSPHRFLPPKAKSKPPSSSLRHQTAVTPSSQFASTPRFTFSSTSRAGPTFTTGSTQFSSPLICRPPASKPQREDIEDVNSEDEDDAGPIDAALPIRSPSRKRRRVQNLPQRDAIIISSSPSSSSDHNDLSPPSTPPSAPKATRPTPKAANESLDSDARIQILAPPSTPLTRPAPSFLFPSTNPHPHQTPRNTSIPARAPVILPPRSPSPEITQSAFFSPSRKGERFVPVGLASRVREWIVESGNTVRGEIGAESRSTGSRATKKRIRIASVVAKGERGALMVRAEGEGGGGEETAEEKGGEGRNWLLISRVEGIGVKGGDVREGSVIHIRGPSWELDLVGEVWHVGVEWVLLEGDRGREG